MAYGEYATAGRCLGKCLYQLSRIGIPLRIVESVVLEKPGKLTYYGESFATYEWKGDTPVFNFSNSLYQEQQQRLHQTSTEKPLLSHC